MTNEEFDRRMRDITERQDRGVLEWEQHREWHRENERKHDVWRIEMEGILTRLARVTKEGFRDTQEKINALINSQIRTEDEQRKIVEAQLKNAELLRITVEQQKKTDEILRRHLGPKRNYG